MWHTKRRWDGIAICLTCGENEQNSHLLTIACSPRVKHVIFPKKIRDNCTFTVCFETGKWLFSLHVGKIATVVKSAIFPSQNRRWKYNFHYRRVGKYYLPKWNLQILSRTFFNKMYIFSFGFKKTLLKIKNSIFQPKYVRYKISIKIKNRSRKNSLRIFFLLDIFGRR